MVTLSGSYSEMSGHQTHLPPHAHRDTCSHCIKGNWVWRRMSQERSCSSLRSIEAFDFVNNAFKWQNPGESKSCGCELFWKQWHLWAFRGCGQLCMCVRLCVHLRTFMCVSVGTFVVMKCRSQKATSCVSSHLPPCLRQNPWLLTAPCMVACTLSSCSVDGQWEAERHFSFSLTALDAETVTVW